MKKTFSREFGEWQFKIKRFGHSHFWLQIKTHLNRASLIVDPFGVPLDFNNMERRTIIPHFGLTRHAHEVARRIYRHGDNLDSWGARDLPPGFHP